MADDPARWRDHVKIIEFLYDKQAEWRHQLPYPIPQLPSRQALTDRMAELKYNGFFFLHFSCELFQRQLDLTNNIIVALYAAQKALQERSEWVQSRSSSRAYQPIGSHIGLPAFSGRRMPQSTPAPPRFQAPADLPTPDTLDRTIDLPCTRQPDPASPIIAFRDNGIIPGRAQETVVVDKKGNKRRRLDLFVSDRSTSVPINSENGTQSSHEQGNGLAAFSPNRSAFEAASGGHLNLNSGRIESPASLFPSTPNNSSIPRDTISGSGVNEKSDGQRKASPQNPVTTAHVANTTEPERWMTDYEFVTPEPVPATSEQSFGTAEQDFSPEDQEVGDLEDELLPEGRQLDEEEQTSKPEAHQMATFNQQHNQTEQAPEVSDSRSIAPKIERAVSPPLFLPDSPRRTPDPHTSDPDITIEDALPTVHSTPNGTQQESNEIDGLENDPPVPISHESVRRNDSQSPVPDLSNDMETSDQMSDTESAVQVPTPDTVTELEVSKEVTALSKGYLGTKALPASDFLFGSPIPKNATFNSESVEGSLEHNYTFLTKGRISAGRRLYASQLIKYCLRASERYPFRRGKKQYEGIIPYKRSLIPRHGTGSFLLVPPKPNTTDEPRPEKVSDWPELAKAASIELLSDTRIGAKCSGDDSDLIRNIEAKYGNVEDDEILPAYNESGSENELDDETWTEMQQESGEARPLGRRSKTPLSQSDVDCIIDSQIAFYMDRWENKQTLAKQIQAYKIWNKYSQSDSSKKLRCKEITKRLAELESEKIPRIRERILEQQWYRADDVKQQCGSLSEFVSEAQSLRWELAILDQTEPPPKPRFRAARRSALLKDQKSIQRGTKRHHEAEMSDEDSDMDDFIVEDEEEGVVVNGEETTEGFEDRSLLPTDVDSEDSSHLPDLPWKDVKHYDKSKSLRKPGNSKNDCIDLTMTDAELTPKRRSHSAVGIKNEQSQSLSGFAIVIGDPPARESTSLSSESKAEISDSPDTVDFGAIEDASFSDYEGKYGRDKDRLGLLRKIFADKKKWRNSLAKYARDFKSHYNDAWRRMSTLLVSIRRASNEPTTDDLDDVRDKIFVRTYIAWHFCSFESGVPPFKTDLIKGLGKDQERFNLFFQDLRTVTREYYKYTKVQPPESKKRGRSHSPDISAPPPSSQKKQRKREVKENAQARKQRLADQERLNIFNRRVEGFASSSQDCLAINPAKDDAFGLVNIDPSIASKIKAHQIQGVRFIWREIIGDGVTSKGCLLAHTMGLGKTMQVITFLSSVAACVKSNDESMFGQIPPPIRSLRFLILCPPSLIDNWYEEILRWMPPKIREGLGGVRPIRSVFDADMRRRQIEKWANGSGILLLGYPLFSRSTTDSKYPDTIKALLEGPSIVVADEAHKMKNTSSKLNQATKQFKTLARIALTGSPLANNMEEYYAMIDWVQPKYLGSAVEFRARFAEPIQNGLYVDSDRAAIRLSQRKLRVLSDFLEPKVDRQGLAILKDQIPSKVEFMISVPLTGAQHRAYASYVQAIKKYAGDSTDAPTALWAQISILGLLCAHPLCFNLKLKGGSDQEIKDILKGFVDANSMYPEKDETGIELGRRQLIQANPDDPPDDNPESPTDFPDVDTVNIGATGVSRQKLLDTHAVLGPDQYSVSLSYRMMILNQIIDLCKKLKEKMLIFSHSLSTLNFIHGLILRKEINVTRIDGATAVEKRQAMSQKFNASQAFEIALISTKAGGLGLNLYGANRVVIIDFGFNPIHEEQAIGRAYRIGQTRPVFVYRFRATGTFEDKLHNGAVFKMQLATRVVDKKTPRRYATSFKAANYIFEPKEVEYDDLSSFVGKDEGVLDRILAQQNTTKSIASIELTESIQKDYQETLSAEDMEMADQEAALERLRFTNDPEYLTRKQKFEAEYAARLRTSEAGNRWWAQSQPTRADANLEFSRGRVPSISQQPVQLQKTGQGPRVLPDGFVPIARPHATSSQRPAPVRTASLGRPLAPSGGPKQHNSPGPVSQLRNARPSPVNTSPYEQQPQNSVAYQQQARNSFVLPRQPIVPSSPEPQVRQRLSGPVSTQTWGVLRAIQNRLIQQLDNAHLAGMQARLAKNPWYINYTMIISYAQSLQRRAQNPMSMTPAMQSELLWLQTHFGHMETERQRQLSQPAPQSPGQFSPPQPPSPQHFSPPIPHSPQHFSPPIPLSPQHFSPAIPPSPQHFSPPIPSPPGHFSPFVPPMGLGSNAELATASSQGLGRGSHMVNGSNGAHTGLGEGGQNDLQANPIDELAPEPPTNDGQLVEPQDTDENVAEPQTTDKQVVEPQNTNGTHASASESPESGLESTTPLVEHEEQ